MRRGRRAPLYSSSRLGTLTHLADGRDDYRYELTDHLGDARVVFHRPTTQVQVETMELSGVPPQAAFLNDDRYRVAVSGAPSGDYVARLTDSQPAGQELKRVLTVTRGDTITFSALAQWKQNAAAGGSGATPFVLLGAAAGVNALSQRGAEGQTTTYATNSPNWLSLLAAGLGFTFGQGAPASLGATSLEGWIKYRVLDAQGNPMLDAQGQPLAGVDYLLGTGKWEYLQTGVRVPQDGTIEVMAGTSGTGEAVYFDNLRVEQTGGLIVQEQHQYAFGAPLPGLSYTVGNQRYRYGYQGQYAEHDDETGFESFELRLYNSWVGRWLSYDPEGEFNSPYVGMGNNPVSGVDPTGGCTVCPLPEVVVTGVSKGSRYLSPIVSNLVLPAISTAVRTPRMIAPSALGYANGTYVGTISQKRPTTREYNADGAKLVFNDLYDLVDTFYKGAQIWYISGRRDIAGRPVTQRESAVSFYSSLPLFIPGEQALLGRGRFPKLTQHYEKHVIRKNSWAQWGSMSKEAYYKRAVSLANRPIGGNIMGFTSEKGWLYKYNSQTNEFLTQHPSGYIETLFRPDNGIDY